MFQTLGWSDEEELIISTIQQTDSVSRPEAIRRMQRLKKSSRWTSFRKETVLAGGRLRRNSRCTRGDNGGPGSLAHLRGDALYCDDACKKAAQRSPNRQKQPSNSQCLCGSKRDKNGSQLSPHQPGESAPQIASNREVHRSAAP
jgi:hypothetical protein